MLKISATSDPKSVAGAIAGSVREEGTAEMQIIGAGANNQLSKAMAIARNMVPELVYYPEFKTIEIDGKAITAMLWTAQRR